MQELKDSLVQRMDTITEIIPGRMPDNLYGNELKVIDMVETLIEHEDSIKKTLLDNDIIPLTYTVIKAYFKLIDDVDEPSEVKDLMKRYLMLHIICDYDQEYTYRDMIVNMFGLDDEDDILQMISLKGVRLLG